ncbi:LacI family DNA-binding transcriptional regulator [Aestuariivirga litoralis]|uniref:LacI family DNA-binding transcriptional regulator n=1 Tax=Aestuariivirga litoralis TaxID=2650924 RepID=UPI001AED43CE|nr:LacI family DNA-binding transcriptional regulator [Aestuariivirga litoralis]
MDDVARLANVSPITVSRALRDPDVVSPELRQRIDAAVEKLAYVPNLAASRLASARSHSVGVIVPTLYNVIFADYLRALHEVFPNAGFQVVVVNSRYSAIEEEKAVRTLLGQRVEAIVIVGVDHTPMTRRLLKQAKIPVVETFELSDDPVDVNIGLSHVAAGRAATQHLLDLGHRQVGFVMGSMDIRAAARLEGYQSAMTQAGIAHDHLIFSKPLPSTIALGSAILADMVKGGAMPDALFCIDDNLAMGAVMKCRELGISVPEKISIIGFHDLEFAAYASPPITTVATPRYDIGKMAAEAVLAKIEKSRVTAPRRVDMGYKILERGSTARRK